MMERGNEKYKKIIAILRESEPVLKSPELIERKVIAKITARERNRISFDSFVDFLFGWVYVGWVRRSLIAASIFLIIVFVWQQGVIVRDVNFLSRQIIESGGEAFKYQIPQYGKELLILKQGGQMFPQDSIKLSPSQAEQLMKSLNDMQLKYNQIMQFIEENPELKRLLEKKLEQKKPSKIKL